MKIIKVLFGCFFKKKPEVGQTWKFFLESDNPWDEDKYLYQEITDIKNGHVRYLFVKSDGSRSPFCGHKHQKISVFIKSCTFHKDK